MGIIKVIDAPDPTLLIDEQEMGAVNDIGYFWSALRVTRINLVRRDLESLSD
jgi:hypothetical protein